MDLSAIDNALDRFGEKSATFTQIVHKDLNKYAQEMADAIESKDMNALHIAAHSSKSIYSLIEVQGALELTKMIEKSASEKNLADCAILHKRLIPFYEAVNAHLEARLKA